MVRMSLRNLFRFFWGFFNSPEQNRLKHYPGALRRKAFHPTRVDIPSSSIQNELVRHRMNRFSDETKNGR